jgi:hypothetical protein
LNLEYIAHSEISQKGQIFHLFEVPRVVVFVETESRTVAARSREGREWRIII